MLSGVHGTASRLIQAPRIRRVGARQGKLQGMARVGLGEEFGSIDVVDLKKTQRTARYRLPWRTESKKTVEENDEIVGKKETRLETVIKRTW
jgi:hypothetical protein